MPWRRTLGDKSKEIKFCRPRRATNVIAAVGTKLHVYKFVVGLSLQVRHPILCEVFILKNGFVATPNSERKYKNDRKRRER